MYCNEEEKKLVDALRSGKYVQAQNRLKEVGIDYNKYCCLGVACDISGIGHWDTLDYYVVGYESNEFYLPDDVQVNLGWSTNRGQLSFYCKPNDRGKILFNIADLNDSGFTFDQIADVIEAGLVEKEGEQK